MSTPNQHKGLSNPAVVAAAQSPAGQKVLNNAINSQVAMAQKTMKVIPYVLGGLAAVGVTYFAWRAWQNRFISLGQNNNLEPANVSDGQAKTKADAIYEAMYGVGANYGVVRANLVGLNYNGWVKVYNAFGKRKTLLQSEMNLAEWLIDQFSNSKLEELRFLIGDVF